LCSQGFRRRAAAESNLHEPRNWPIFFSCREVKSKPRRNFAENLFAAGRHVEVQLWRTCTATWRLRTRDCSLQRRRQKVLEEAPCATLPADLLSRIEACSRDSPRPSDTAAPEHVSISWMQTEMPNHGNEHRIQVEHTVSEEA
jgi:acetyl/propionyl-CoA carboxylase alpha subunit